MTHSVAIYQCQVVAFNSSNDCRHGHIPFSITDFNHLFPIFTFFSFSSLSGMHRVKMYHLRRKVHFVIMTSVFDTPEKIHTVYDLKGSLIGE